METTEWIIGIVVLAGTAGFIMTFVDWIRDSQKRIRTAKEDSSITWSDSLANIFYQGMLWGSGALVVFMIGIMIWANQEASLGVVSWAGEMVLGIVAVAGMAIYWVGGIIGAAVTNPTFMLVVCTLVILQAINRQRN